MSGSAKTSDALKARSAARLAAVQALYQMEIAGTDLNELAGETIQGIIADGEGQPGGENLTPREPEHFRKVIFGVVASQATLDPEIDAHLAKNWTLGRVDTTLRAILRAGAFELQSLPDIPFKVVISEYVDVAHAFFDGPEPKVVNAVLDALAGKFRPGERGRKSA
ncbi:MAG: transcription antitermination factor NusB [Alphaproteobacteria bacterium]